MKFLIVSGGSLNKEFVTKVVGQGRYDRILAADSGMNALYAADVFLTPVKFDNFCRDNLTMVEDAYHEILENNPDLEWKIFANMVSNTKAQKLSSEDLIAKHDYPFMQSCISRTAIVDNALSLYKPVAKHRVMSNVAQDFVDLVEELLED